ncbi:proline-rich receptor-like protein kinase PERK9 [Meles meles]|uniref:proline-rich receptor-like protein kinase PERK9 n=1 Tax=Meles meles TaxID=9662 RepID=UPI001E69BF5E|nr:proline-rich receptor-like protein kinase PERK9 [Meles meles]
MGARRAISRQRPGQLAPPLGSSPTPPPSSPLLSPPPPPPPPPPSSSSSASFPAAARASAARERTAQAPEQTFSCSRPPTNSSARSYVPNRQTAQSVDIV